tara:strand:+ start:82 stop:420 length:339 start_codon:yes stop_codon:yes gene_type:complete
MTIVDDIIFSVPKNQKYTLADIHDELQMVYGDVERVGIWRDYGDFIWYHATIKWVEGSDNVKNLKAGMYDGNGSIYISHYVNKKHCYFFDVPIYSYKMYVYGQYANATSYAC